MAAKQLVLRPLLASPAFSETSRPGLTFEAWRKEVCSRSDEGAGEAPSRVIQDRASPTRILLYQAARRRSGLELADCDVGRLGAGTHPT